MGDNLLRWFANHNATLSFITEPHNRCIHITVRGSYGKQTPDLYAGCKLTTIESDQPSGILDAVERLVEQIERVANAERQRTG
jgi:hypothetical protein